VDAGYEKPDNALIRRDLGNLPPRGTSDDRCKGSGVDVCYIGVSVMEIAPSNLTYNCQMFPMC